MSIEDALFLAEHIEVPDRVRAYAERKLKRPLGATLPGKLDGAFDVGPCTAHDGLVG